jgi:hypothetical protein
MKETMQCAIENMPADLYNALVAKPILSIDVQRKWINSELGLNIPLDILKQIEAVINNQPFFAKFSTRSPKDYLGNKNGTVSPIKNISEFVKCFNGCHSLRTFEEVEEFYHDKELKYKIHILPWIDIPQQDEWRCFVRGGKLIAVSQYYHHLRFNDFAPNKDDIIAFASQYLPHLPMENIVMDIVYGQGLLELNPWGKSDPCLFNAYKAGGTNYFPYSELNAMDGSEVAFRYNVMDKVSE